ncbi:MAG: hypothetical protein MJ087_07425 [Lachnospiraceae bacterium]|nr:hypothetical protein [Lachnospiraceae bacterium]
MIIRQNIYMNTLQREREVVIYLPDDYETSGRRYPVMYINDGQNAFFDDQAYLGKSWGFIDHVRWNNEQVIMVAIPCNFEPGMREMEYGPWETEKFVTIMETGKSEPNIGGEGKAYVDFLKDELKPFMDANYPTDPEDTAIVGSSAGGNISLYAALTYPETFGKCAALSCAIWYYPKQFQALVREADLSKLKCLYLDVGSDEGNGNSSISNLYRYDNNVIYEMLMEKENNECVHYAYYDGARHSEEEWRKRVPAFMFFFYHG